MSRGERLSILGLYNYNPNIFNMMVFPDQMPTADQKIVKDNILFECADLELIYPSWDSMQIMIKLWSQMEKPVWDRIYKASKLEYNPIDNYNRTEKETISTDRTETHSGEDKTTASGTDSSTLSGTDSIESSGTDTRTNSYNKEEVTRIDTTEKSSGSDKTINSNTGYNGNQVFVHDESDLNHGKQIRNSGENSVADGGSETSSMQYGKKDSTTYGRTDTITHGKTDTLTHGEKIDHDEDITRELHAYGNIGVTTTQKMLGQEIDISPRLNIIKIMVQSFKERFCVLLY